MDSISLIRTPIEAELEAFKKLFDSSLSSSNALLDSVVSHIRQRNGKMMRPILVLLVARLYGAVTPATLHAAVSLELLQLSNVSNHSFSESVYFDVIRKKTAALFAACTKAAALSVDANEEEAEFARLLGEYIGICFQIKDDIFDYFNSKEIGKPTGNDMLEGKLTLPALYVLNNTKDDTAREIAIKVKDGTATPDEIARLIAFIKENGGIEYAIQTMNLYKEKALGLLASLPDSDVCTALRAYLNYVVDREK